MQLQRSRAPVAIRFSGETVEAGQHGETIMYENARRRPR